MKDFIKSKEEFLKMVQAWKDYVNSGGKVHAMHHFIYNVIRRKDPKKGFTPVTRQSRLDAGHAQWGSFMDAKYRVSSEYTRHEPRGEPFMFGLSREEYGELCMLIVSYLKS